MRLTFEEGTLLLRDYKGDEAPPAFVWDARVDLFRAQAHFYRESLDYLKRESITFKNTAPRYQTLSLSQQSPPDPHPHQSESITAWIQHGRRGVVVLPTGSGKSQVALMAMLEVQRSTLIVAPTIDLMNQWYDLLSKAFAIDVGLLGGGYHEIEDVTVATYDSAYMHMERLGNRFGLIVFDEVHHLPGEMYSHAAEMCIAPNRLGLTATPERADGRHVLLDTLVGPVAYERGIRELSGEYLAEYRVERRQVQMVAEERVQYEAALHEYQRFLQDKNIRLGSANGWRNFVMLSAKSTDGRRAMHAYRRHRQIALGTTAKMRVLEEILKAHPRDRVLIFTNDNESVHEISETFLIPAITHRTRTKERKYILEAFKQGRISGLGRLQGTQRRRQYTRGQCRRGALRFGHYPRTRAAPWPHSAPAPRQAGRALRSHLKRHR
jgi:superfamily II DNA or RNA helicase